MSNDPQDSGGKGYHIIGVAANLLGICFVLITGLKVTNRDIQTYADEVCLVTAFVLLMSCLFSYLSIRTAHNVRYERYADYCFLAGISSLFIAMFMLAVGY